MAPEGQESFRHELRNYTGNLSRTSLSEREGLFLLGLGPGRYENWELNFPVGRILQRISGCLIDYRLTVTGRRHGCHVVVRHHKDPEMQGEFDLTDISREQFLQELSSFNDGFLSLPPRPWPMIEVKQREPLADLVDRQALMLAGELSRSIAQWAPSHELAGRTRETARSVLWALVYFYVACPAQWEPWSRQQVLDRVDVLTQRRPAPQDLSPQDASAALMTSFTFLDVDELAWRLAFEHKDENLLLALENARVPIMHSFLCFMDPDWQNTRHGHARSASNFGALMAAHLAVGVQSYAVVRAIVNSDAVFCPPTLHEPSDQNDLMTWWVQIPGQELPVTLGTLVGGSPRQDQNAEVSAPAPKSGAAQLSATCASASTLQEPAAPPAPGNKRARAASDVSPLDVLLGQLDGLTGLASVKRQVRQIVDVVRAEKMRRAAGLPVSQISRHLVFTGNPGTGKTTVGRLLGQLYAAIGVLGTGQLVQVTRADLVAGFVGQTALKTTEAVNRALGGILFIDEAYALARPAGSGHDFGQEAVDTLVSLMEDHRDDLVVIAAGYGDEMAQFISSNPGLPSRFPRTIHFPDYGTDELLSIFKGMCDRDRYEITGDALGALGQYLDKLPRSREFGNGRLVRNLFEAAVARQASRVVAAGSADLTTLTIADLDLPAAQSPNDGRS